MLTKILKYDFLYFSHKLLPMYVIFFVFTIVAELSKFFVGTEEYDTNFGFFLLSLITELSLNLLAMLSFFIATFTIYLICKKFFKLINTSDGYLLHTLPVNTHIVLFSQYLVSTIYVFFSTIIVLIFVNIIEDIYLDFTIYYNDIYNILLKTFIFLALFFIILGSICISHLFKKYRLVVSIAAFIAINCVFYLLNSYIYSLLGLFNLSYTNIIVLIYTIAMSIATMLTLHFVMYYILKNRINIC